MSVPNIEAKAIPYDWCDVAALKTSFTGLDSALNEGEYLYHWCPLNASVVVLSACVLEPAFQGGYFVGPMMERMKMDQWFQEEMELAGLRLGRGRKPANAIAKSSPCRIVAWQRSLFSLLIAQARWAGAAPWLRAASLRKQTRGSLESASISLIRGSDGLTPDFDANAVPQNW